MKPLILDYSTWRCGDIGPNQLGDGETALSNEDGFMCCLGQISLQLNPLLTDEDINGLGEPGEVKKSIPLLTLEDEDENGHIYFRSSSLSTEAIKINDEQNTTPEEKIEQFKELFYLKGYEIQVINKQ